MFVKLDSLSIKKLAKNLQIQFKEVMDNKKQGILYIVPTPIGNLGDMTYRGVEVLNRVSQIGAEDTRTSKTLLNKYGIRTPVISYHKFNERKRTNDLLAELKQGRDIAIISDAGSPGISDPALILINQAINNGIRVEILPGATSIIPAVLQSNLYEDAFYFCGYLPDKQTLRKEKIEKLQFIEAPLIFFVGPHDLIEFLTTIHTTLGNRKITICREISKIHETIYRSQVNTFIEDSSIILQKGEFVIVVEGYVETEIDEKTVKELLNSYLNSGISTKEAVKLVFRETGFPRNKIYRIALDMKNK